MQHLFSPEGERALVAVMRMRPLLAFDFDGTLAPIVARPDDAVVPEAVSRLLVELAGHLPLAVISGRAVADVSARLGFPVQHVVGNHGAEELGVPVHARPHPGLDALRRRLRAEAAVLRHTGIEVEDKRLSLALHYRGADDPAAALARIEALLADDAAALTTFGGKAVVNVLPAGLPDKGQALATLVARSKAAAAFFAGDDVNDEAVFESAESHWLTVRVGPPEPLSRAMFMIERDDELVELLERMLVCCRT